MKHTLSFGYLTLITPKIFELIIDDNAVITAEMYAEYAEYIANYQHANEPYSVLVNNINNYQLSKEVKSLVTSNINLSAIAVVIYTNLNTQVISDFLAAKEIRNNKANLQVFSGLDMGRSKAIRWLELELTKSSIKI